MNGSAWTATSTVGITDYAQGQLGDVVYVELPAVGKAVTKGALKPNTASRRISRLTQHVNGLSGSRS